MLEKRHVFRTLYSVSISSFKTLSCLVQDLASTPATELSDDGNSKKCRTRIWPEGQSEFCYWKMILWTRSYVCANWNHPIWSLRSRAWGLQTSSNLKWERDNMTSSWAIIVFQTGRGWMRCAGCAPPVQSCLLSW